MGREIRRVPLGWEHPKRSDGRYQPLYDEDFESAEREWKEDAARWADGTHEDLVGHPEFKREFPAYEDWAGGPPDPAYYRKRKWTPEEATCWQYYETVSEGTPLSPVFETAEALVRWLVEVEGHSEKAARRFVLCEEAVVTSTKGSVVFDRDGTRRVTKEKVPRGAIFRGLVRLTREEVDAVRAASRLLLPPADVEVTLDGERIASRVAAGSFRASLVTEIGDEEGRLRRVRRETEVRLYAARSGEKPMLYELGIPIVELEGGEPWHIDVRQRVPLNIDRDNVTPAYLRELRVHLLNHEHAKVVGTEAATRGWVRDAAASPDAKTEAVAHVLTERFGEKRVAQDPSDPEGTKLAVAAGYTVVPGGSLSKGEWENARRDDLLPRAGAVTPSAPERAEKSRAIPLEEWTAGMRHVASLTTDLANLLLEERILVTMSEAPDADVLASWTEAERRLNFNVPKLGAAWFAIGPTVQQVDLILHELAHAVVRGDHLTKDFNDACTGLGARLVFFVADRPEWLRERAWKEPSAGPPAGVKPEATESPSGPIGRPSDGLSRRGL